jgi:hypothetical protein
MNIKEIIASQDLKFADKPKEPKEPKYIKGDLHFSRSFLALDLPKFSNSEVLEFCLRKNFKKAYVYNSLVLEGSTFTFDEVSRTLDGEKLDVHKTQKEISDLHGMSRAIDYMVKHLDEEISVEHIKELNLWVGNVGESIRYAGSIRGTIPMDRKDVQVWSDGRMYFGVAAGTNGENLVRNFNERFGMLEKFTSPHKGYFWSANATLIQYFKDGNKRTARLAQDWINAKEGYLPVIFETNEQKRQYEDNLRTLFTTEDGSDYVEFMYRTYLENYFPNYVEKYNKLLNDN